MNAATSMQRAAAFARRDGRFPSRLHGGGGMGYIGAVMSAFCGKGGWQKMRLCFGLRAEDLSRGGREGAGA